MVRVRVGNGWLEDPAVRLALARGGAEAAAAAGRASDAVAIEVDGVDVASGRAEGPLLPTLAALAGAVAGLVGGGLSAQVHLPEGAVELLLRRRGATALLSVVSLGRPSRLLARDVAVELPALAAAVATAAAELLAALASAHPGLARTEPARDLRRAASRLAAARPASPSPPPLAAGRGAGPGRRSAAGCSFEIRDDEGLLASYRGPGPDLGSLLAPGRVVVRAPDGRLALAADGIPYLLLRDLAALAERIVAAARAGEPEVRTALAPSGGRRRVDIAVRLQRRTVAVGRAAPVALDPLHFAGALLEGALDFCGAVAARNPWQGANGYLVELGRAAAMALAQVRELAEGDIQGRPRPGVRATASRRPPQRQLVPGSLRRLAWRRLWERDVGPPAGACVFPLEGATLLCGAEETALVGGSGQLAWRAPGSGWAALEGQALLQATGPRLRRVDLATGRPAWTRATPAEGAAPPSSLLRLRGGALLLCTGPVAAALDPASGATRWRFEPPGAQRVEAAALGALAVLAADTGLLYGVDAAGRLAWRLRAPGPPAGPPRLSGGLCLVAAATRTGGALLAFDPATGRRAWEAPLDFHPGGPPVPFGGRAIVPGLVAGDPLVGAVEPDGAVAWTTAPPIGKGPPALSSAGALLFARCGDGPCCALDRTGALRWVQAHGPAQAASPGLAAAPARGVVIVPGDPLVALDARSGAPLGQARLPVPARLFVDADLGLVAVDSLGLAVAARLAQRLSLVR